MEEIILLKYRYLILIMIVFLFAISAVSANDLNNTDALSIYQDESLISSPSEDFFYNDYIDNGNIRLDVPNVEKYYGGPERYTATLKDSSGNPISNAKLDISINSISYSRYTNNLGQVSMGINLNSGSYNVITQYGDEEAHSVVTVKDTILSNDFSKIYKNGTQYYATAIDGNGNVLKNTPIKININGVYYTRTTNENGIFKMNINLNPGTYVLTADNPISGEKHTTTITVLPSIVENNDLIKYYRSPSKFTFRLLDDMGNPVRSGVSATLNINGVFYTRLTNDDGYVNMNINLNPGVYTATIEYNGLKASNTIRVLNILEGNDVNMKFRDGSKFEATLLDGNGQPFSGQTIIFNINGVFYQRTTDSRGVASLNINLRAGEYIITAEYNGLKKSNVIRISPDPLYYTIGTNPLDYNYYMNEYNRFTYDWYYSPQHEAMVRTIYDIYGNNGMEIQDQYVHYGTKYICWQESTGYNYCLNKEGEVISVTNMGDYYVDYKEYDYNNNEIIYHNIYLPNYDTELTTEIDGFDVNVQQWRTPSYSEVDIIVYDKSGNILDLYDYDTMILNSGKWYGPYDQEANYYVSTYHKWHMPPSSRTTEVAVKIRANR